MPAETKWVRPARRFCCPGKPLGGNLCAAIHEAGDDLGFLWQTGRRGIGTQWETALSPFVSPCSTADCSRNMMTMFTEQRALTILWEPLSTQNTTSPCQFLLRMHFPGGPSLQCHLLWLYAHRVHMCGQSECQISSSAYVGVYKLEYAWSSITFLLCLASIYTAYRHLNYTWKIRVHTLYFRWVSSIVSTMP